jgi:hypothetical protein
MKPIEHMTTMAALNFPPGLTNGDMALPLLLQAVALFLQEDIGKHGQPLEAHNGSRADQLRDCVKGYATHMRGSL